MYVFYINRLLCSKFTMPPACMRVLVPPADYHRKKFFLPIVRSDISLLYLYALLILMRSSIIHLLATWICSTTNCCIRVLQRNNIYTVYSCDYGDLANPKHSGWASRLDGDPEKGYYCSSSLKGMRLKTQPFGQWSY